jgi:hypothetical protein
MALDVEEALRGVIKNLALIEHLPFHMNLLLLFVPFLLKECHPSRLHTLVKFLIFLDAVENVIFFQWFTVLFEF